MNTAFNISKAAAARAPEGGIDWEFQPSMQHLVKRTQAARPDATVWAETMPATLDEFNQPVVFREPLEGLAMRDIDEPEIFLAFFGEAATSAAGRV